MTAQKIHATTHPAVDTGKPGCGRGTAMRAVFAAALMGCIVPAVGCKTGTSFTKPSWWTLGGTPKTDADSLAAAPPYGGDIKKPSESAKAYPTTSTPSGYVITGTAAPGASATGAPAPGAQQFQTAQQQAPVVYGSTPVPQSTPAAAVAAASPTAMPQQSAPSSIAPQVGPYAPLAGDSIPPPGQPLQPFSPSTTPGMASASGMTERSGMASMPGMSATPSESTLPNTAYSNFSAPPAGPTSGSLPAPRMADARAVDPAAAIPAAALPVEQSAYGGSRYSTNTGSRFGGAEAASFPSSSAAAPSASYTAPSAAYAAPSASYATPPESGFAAPPAAAPLGAPPAVSPAAAPATPGLLQPSAQPVRRPDPGYRPGGTSSYRPSRTILADESAPATSTVRTASFEEPSGTVQQ